MSFLCVVVKIILYTIVAKENLLSMPHHYLEMNNIKVSLPNHPALPYLNSPIPQVPIHMNSALWAYTHTYIHFTQNQFHPILTLLSAAAHTAVIFPPYTQHCTIIY